MNQYALYKAIGQAVRSARESRELTQDDLAAKVQLTRVSITNLESGNQRSPVHVIYQIAEVLGVPAHQLLPPIDEVGAVIEVTVAGKTHRLTVTEAAELRRQLDQDSDGGVHQ